MKKTKLVISIFTLFALVFFTATPHPFKNVYAASDNLSTAITWGGNCNDAIYDNGLTSAYAYYSSGDTVNLTVNNNSSEALEIGLKGSSPIVVSANSSAPVTISLGDEADVQVYSGSCTQAIESNLIIFGYSGSVSCSLQGKVWNVLLDFDGVAPSVSLYKGSVYIDTLSDTSGGPGGGNVSVSLQFAGKSSAATYYVYNGANSSSALIGQATCSAVPSAPPPPASSTTPASTPSPGGSATTTPAQTTTTPTTKSTLTPETDSANSNKKTTTTPKKINSSNTRILIGSGLALLLIILVIIVLGALGIWMAPMRLLRRLWKFLRRLPHKETPPPPTT